ncbi:MAG: GDP-mannose 4,6-dehydratase [Planctomycetota bacterium]|nr:GDP-mannose 4,6-dehydratase [Planctomycetota bacterium]
MSETVLVTGAAGFIGSHVCVALASRGQRVIGLDNFDPFYPRAVKERARDAIVRAGVLFVEGDITDAGALASLLARERPQGVIHLAAKAGVRPSIADPAGYARANVLGTAAVQDACATQGVGRLVVASSSSVYGNATTAPFREDQDVSQPISPYAATKRACELIGYTHHIITGMPTAMLRFFTVYGPRQRPDLAIAKFIAAIARGEPITLFGDGTTSRDYTFIDDIVAGVLAAYDRIPTHGYRVWNLGSDAPISLAAMVRTIERVVGRAAVIERAPMQQGDVERTWADLTRARAELSYAPRTPFEEGVRRQWDWWRAESR